MADIFISYSKTDRDRARILASALENLGWSVWWDPVIPPGKNFADVIDEELAAAQCVLALWSKVSVEKNWVREEAQDGLDRGILVPVLIEDVKPPRGFRLIQAANLIDWYGTEPHTGFDVLVSELTRILGTPPKQSQAERRRGQETEARGRVSKAPTEWQEQGEIEPEKRRPPTQIREDKTISSAANGSASTGGSKQWNWRKIVFYAALLVLVPTFVGVLKYLVEKDLATMPALTRTSEEAASQELVDRHFRFSIEKEFSESTEPGIVLRHSPQAGAEFDPDKVTVKLVVSHSVGVPAIVGHTLPAATRILEERGLGPGRIDERQVETDQAGKIIGQSPLAGARVREGTTVDLVVGREEVPAATVATPPVVGESLQVAEEILNEHGLVLGRVEERYADPHRAGQVIVQNPAAGVRIDRGSTVDLVVGLSEAAEVALTVETDPPGARVQILNIERSYSPGIRLQPGRYEIEVSHPEFLPCREWIDLGAENVVFEARLEKVNVRAMGARAVRPGEHGTSFPGDCALTERPEGEDSRNDD